MWILILLYIIAFVVLIFITTEKKMSTVKAILKSINESYFELKISIKGWLKFFGIMLLGTILLITINLYRLFYGKEISFKGIIIFIVSGILTLLILYLGFGSLLAVFSKTIAFIEKVENKKMKIQMVSSLLFLASMSFFSLVLESEMRKIRVFLFVGVLIYYIVNMIIMFEIARNPFCIVADQDAHKSENKVLLVFCSFFIVLMIIFNLYLFVLWTYFSYEGAYTCEGEITKWNLLYYTFISFTTIGYGDISPAIFPSQAVAILISLTSVTCLIIFVSSILSAISDKKDSNHSMMCNWKAGHKVGLEQGVFSGIELTKKALRLSKQGKSVQEIVAELDISEEQARKMIE